MIQSINRLSRRRERRCIVYVTRHRHFSHFFPSSVSHHIHILWRTKIQFYQRWTAEVMKNVWWPDGKSKKTRISRSLFSSAYDAFLIYVSCFCVMCVYFILSAKRMLLLLSSFFGWMRDWKKSVYYIFMRLKATYTQFSVLIWIYIKYFSRLPSHLCYVCWSIHSRLK